MGVGVEWECMWVWGGVGARVVEVVGVFVKSLEFDVCKEDSIVLSCLIYGWV